MHVEKHTVSVTTAADGSATAYTTATITGRVLNAIYAKTDFDNGVTFAITGEDSGVAIWNEAAVNASKTIAPVQAASLTTGAASTLTESPVVVAYERIKIVISAGGNVKSGTFTFLTGG